MATDYVEIAAAATEMLAEYGLVSVLTKAARPDYNTTTSEVEGGKPKDYQAVAVRDEYKIREIDGTRILRGDARIYLSTTDVEGAEIPQPAPGDSLAYAGEKFRVVDCTPVKPADVAVLYELQVRK